MRISGSAKRLQGETATPMQAGAGLKKPEFLADLFNNQPAGKEDKQAVKLRLSHASRTLQEHLHKELRRFLKEHPQVHQHLNELPLPEEEWGESPQNVDLSLRKLCSYLRWSHLRKENEPEAPHDAPFLSIQQLDQEKQLQRIYHNNLQQLEELKRLFQKSAPNYYYLVYPETYAFN